MPASTVTISQRGSGAIWWALGGAALFLGWRRFIAPVHRANVLRKDVARYRMPIYGVKIKKDDVIIDVWIQNPNSTGLTITAIVGEAWIVSNLGRLKIGNVFRYGTIFVKPVNETKFQIPIRTRFIPMLAYFNQLFAGKMTYQVLQFTGTININGTPYPFNESYKIA